MNDRVFLICLGGFTAGIMARSFFDLGISFPLFLFLISIAVYFLGRIQPPSPDSPRRIGAGGLAFLALFIFASSLGMFRFDLSDLHRNDPALDQHLNQRVAVFGVITGEPDERETSIRLAVDLDSPSAGGQPTQVAARALVVANLYPKFQYGDRIQIFGLLAKPQNFADDAGKIFDYRSYLAVGGIYYQITQPQIKLIESGQGNFVVAPLLKFKQAFLNHVSAMIPEPHSSLLGGLVVGAKHALGKNLLEDFRRAGVIHIVVLSGYNITIVAEAVMKFFAFLPRSLGQSLGVLGIILFAIMTGGSATVVRASIMALLVILARATGRNYNIVRALLLAGFFMVLQNPKILVFDSSFQLSFMSTIALIYAAPILERYFSFVTEKFGLRSVVVATLATQIFVLPMLLYKMGQFSVVALPVNFLILFVIPATMFFGFFSGVLGFASNMLALPFAFVAYGLLDYELRVVAFFSHLPFATIDVGYFPLWFAVLIYFLYFSMYLRFRPQPKVTA